MAQKEKGLRKHLAGYCWNPQDRSVDGLMF